MAKSLLLNVLVDVLGNYVEGLSHDNLKLGVWSGKIELNNLKLKSSSLDGLNLPLQVARGSLKKLKLKIPWTQLESKPVQVIIDGVFLQAGPLDLTKQSTEDLQKAVIAAKVKQLKQIDGTILDVLHNEALHEKVKKATYIQQLTTKIVDNIEVTLTNVHIRYEDAQSIPGCVFSAGVTIDSISLSTTDANWSVAFVTRELQAKVESAIHKLGMLQNIGVYWNKNSRSFLDLDYPSWEKEMQSAIYSPSMSPSTHDMPRSNNPNSIYSMNYMLEPPNQLSLKLIHREACTETTPKVDVIIECTTLPFKIDSSQYQQVMHLSSSMGELDRRKLNALMRPKARPDKDPRAWWLYAYKLVTGKSNSAGNKMETMIKCIQSSDAYISHVRRSAMVTELGGASAVITETLAKEQPMIDKLEADLPLSALLIYRQMALKEAVAEIQKCRADVKYAHSKGFTLDQENGGGKKSVFSSLWGTSKSKRASVTNGGGGGEDADAGHHTASAAATGTGGNNNDKAKDSKKKSGGGLFSSWFGGGKKKDSKDSSPTSPPTAATTAASPHKPSVVPAVLKREESDSVADTASMTSDMDADDEQIMEALEAKLGAAAEESAAQAAFSLRINLISTQTLTVTHCDLPVLFLSMQSRAKVEMRLNSTMCNFTMNNMYVEDTCTVKPFNKLLVSMTELSTSSSDGSESMKGSSVKTPRTPSAGTAVSTAAESAQCSVTFENRPGLNRLRVHSSPLEIAWNEKCIQKLLAFIASPGASSFARNQSSSRVSSVSRFAAQSSTSAGTAALSVTEISVEMYAPKFLIPENCYRDEGCMLLDAGHLVLRGTIHPTSGMQWNVALKSVNIGMPRSQNAAAAAAAEHQEEELYLIKPFDITTVVQNVNKTEADLSVDVKVLPSVKGELDAIKIGRMLCIANVLTRSFDTSQVLGVEDSAEDEEQPTNSGTSSVIQTSSAAHANAAIVLDNTQDDKKSGTAAVDVTRVKLRVQFSCPEVSVALAISPGHSVSYAYLNIGLTVVMREHDLVVGLGVKSFQLLDSMRPKTHQHILWTPQTGHNTDVVSVTYRALKAKASPLYNGNKSELEVTLSKICLSIDEASTLRFKPFVVELVQSLNLYQNHHTAPALRRKNSSAESMQQAAAAAAAAASASSSSGGSGSVDPLGGMFLMFALESVELQVLTPVKEGRRKSTKLEAGLNSMILGIGDVEQPVKQYETAFQLDCEGLYAEMSLAQLKQIKAHLKSFGIVDQRAVNENFFYNSLINKSLITRANMDSASADDEINLLSLEVNQVNSKAMNVNIALQDVTSVISVDMALDFVDLLMKNVNAATAVAAGFSQVDESMSKIVTERAEKARKAARSSVAVAMNANAIATSHKLKQRERRSLGTSPDHTKSPASDVAMVDAVEEDESSSIVVSFRLVNPRLLLIENPENEHSKAIESHCGLTVQYTRVTKNAQRNELQEVVHVALEKAEVLVRIDVADDSTPSHRIVEPTNVIFSLKKDSEKEKTLSTTVTLSTEPISSRVSLNDIVLASTIIARANLTKSDKPPPVVGTEMTVAGSSSSSSAVKKAHQAASAESTTPSDGSDVSLTIYKVQVNLDQISLMLINDFNSANIPIAQLTIDDAEFGAKGISQQMTGEGSVAINAEYYNLAVASWEPLLELWNPTLSLNIDFDSIVFEFSSPHTVQINLSGAFCKCLYNAAWLMSQIGKEGSYGHRKIIHPLVVRNLLGVPVVLVDSHTQNSILSLETNELQVVPPTGGNGGSGNGNGSNSSTGYSRKSLMTSSAKYNKQLANHPDLFDIHFTGPFGEERMPVLQLPLYINRPRPYTLHQTHAPPNTSSAASSASGGNAAGAKNIYSESIVEEAYQNQRYYPLKGCWADPWAQFNDCAAWTDVRGRDIKDKKAIPLPPGWKWVEPEWRVDLEGVQKGAIDSDGFEYGTNFASFAAAKKRRTQQPLDVVRRRRWIRTRAPIPQETAKTDSSGSSSIMTTARPLTVVWDVKTRSDGSRDIKIRSGVQIKNEMPFDIDVDIVDATRDNRQGGPAVTAACVAAGKQYSVPLLQSYFSFLNFRPVIDDAFQWSENVYCKGNESFVIRCSSPESGTVFMRISITQLDRSQLITISPNAIVYNRLPCALVYHLNGTVDAQELQAGEQSKIVLVDFSTPVDVTLDVLPYVSTYSFRVASTAEVKDQELVLSTPDGTCQMSVTLSVSNNVTTGITELFVYSKYALVDYSHCQIVTRTKRHDIKNAKVSNPADCIDRFSFNRQDSFTSSGDLIKPTNYWAVGSHGFTLFQTLQHKFSLGVEAGAGWVHDIALDSLEASKSTVEVSVPNAKHCYNLAFSVNTLLGAYSSTQVLSVMPCYVIVNCMDEQLSLIQAGPNVTTDDVSFVDGRQSTHWHKRNAKAGTSVFLKAVSTGWSIGTVDLNDIGTTSMILPQSDENFSYGSNLFVVHVEVALSGKDDLSYITVVVWRSQVKKVPRYESLWDASSCALSVRNESQLPVVVEQSGLSQSYFGDAKLKYDLCVPSGQWQAYGWSIPDESKVSLSVAIGTSSNHLQGALRVINTLKVGEEVSLDMSEIGNAFGSVKMVMTTLGNGKVLRIFSSSGESSIKAVNRGPVRDLTFKCDFKSIGLSLIAERPNRREFFSMYVDQMELVLCKSGSRFGNEGCSGIEFRVMDIQIDNYTESMIYPVLLSSQNGSDRINAQKARRRAGTNNGGGGGAKSIKSSDNSSTSGGSSDDAASSNNQELYFLQFNAVKEDTPGSTTTVLKYVAFRMLDAKISIDSSTLFLYLCDVHADLFVSKAGADLNDPSAVCLYVNNVNEELLQRQQQVVDLDKAYKSAQASKIYFESFIIHPIRLTLTYTATKCPRTLRQLNKIPGYRSLKRIQNVATVDEFEIRINSFMVNYAMESVSSLQSRIVTKIVKDITSHLVQIAGSLFGSLSMLGKPAGLAKNIGGGVQDFFYEPYMGMMESPTGFVRGVGKGTTSLVTGVASGVISSAATIVGSATGGVNSVAKSVVNLTGDDKYVKQREERRREVKAAHGGVVSGFKAGGESIVSGFTSGISGLVTKPYEEGKKGGALGFMKGVGMGLVGVAVKPVMGVSDGLANVAQGFSHQVSSDLGVVTAVRPPRAFLRSYTDPNDLILINVDLFSAEAQQEVTKRASRKDYKDRYHHTVLLGYDRAAPPPDSAYAVTISDVYIFLFAKNTSILWLIPFGEISHFTFRRDDPTSIELVVYRSLSASTNAATPLNSANLYIPCANRSQAVKLYSQLFHYSHRMGNPGNVLPVEVASGDALKKQISSSSSSGGGNVDATSAAPALQHAHSTSLAAVGASAGVALKEYVFGTANARHFTLRTASDKDILNAFAARMSHIETPTDIALRFDYLKALDESVWELISQWKHNHGSMWNMSRCAACLIINNSKNYVQILNTKLMEGLDVNAYGVSGGYDKDSRSLLPNGGAVVLFTYGYLPTLTDLAHVKIVVHTSVFQAMISTRKDRTTCTNEAGGHAGFAEKTQTDTWAKSVIVINQ